MNLHKKAETEVLQKLEAYKQDLINNRTAFIEGLSKKNGLQHAMEFHSFESAVEIDIKLEWVNDLLHRFKDPYTLDTLLGEFQKYIVNNIMNANTQKPIGIARINALRKLHSLFTRYVRTIEGAVKEQVEA